MLVRMCSNKKKFIAGLSLLVDSLTLESNLLASHIECVSILDLSISFLYIYPTVLVLKIWLWDFWGVPRSFHGVFKVRTIFIRLICLFYSHFGTVEFSRGYVIKPLLWQLMECVFVYSCVLKIHQFQFLLPIIITHLKKAFWRSLILNSEPPNTMKFKSHCPGAVAFRVTPRTTASLLGEFVRNVNSQGPFLTDLLKNSEDWSPAICIIISSQGAILISAEVWEPLFYRNSRTVFRNVHSNSINNSKTLDVTEMSNSRMDKYVVECLHVNIAIRMNDMLIYLPTWGNLKK